LFFYKFGGNNPSQAYFGQLLFNWPNDILTLTSTQQVSGLENNGPLISDPSDIFALNENFLIIKHLFKIRLPGKVKQPTILNQFQSEKEYSNYFVWFGLICLKLYMHTVWFT
jgi:hypothetical protein